MNKKSPSPCTSSAICESKAKNPPPPEDNLKEWEDVRCPICMEHPHNAVLLVCSAYNKGCRPYMCDTSYRHSNCLDQFRKYFVCPPLVPSETVTAEIMVTSQQERKSQLVPYEIANMHKLPQKLVCPLCRGKISGWVVVDSSRDFMNAKTRSCASETCEFIGNYDDLRKHARLDHPQVRPSEVDPERQQSWRRFERQRDMRDVFSTIESNPGENRDEVPLYDDDWITIFLLLQALDSSPSSSSNSLSRTFREHTRIQLDPRRRSNGERASFQQTVASLERDESSDDGSVTMGRRVRRRSSTPDNEV